MSCNQSTIQTCTAQTLILDSTVGDLSISDGNTVNLGDTVKLLETDTQIQSFTLTGSILQLVYLPEDRLPQAVNVDLSPLVSGGASISVQDTSSIDLTFDGVTLKGSLKIDPSSTAPVSASSNGVKFDCCPEIPITTNVTNTIQLIPSGNGGHVLTANLKYQDSPSLHFYDSNLGLSGSVKLSTDTGNALILGTDGALYAQTSDVQLANLPTNGFVTTGPSGTLLVGSDSKLYRIPTPNPETPVTAIDTNTVNLTVSGISNHTIQADVNLVNSDTITLTSTSNGIQADVKIDGTAPGNILITSHSNGLVANANAATIAGIQSTLATVQNPITKVFGTLNNSSAGYAPVFISQYGIKIPVMTTSQRTSIPNGDLYDSLLVFDNTLRQFMWYDAVNSIWLAIGSGSGTTPTPPVISTLKINGVVDAVGSPFTSGTTYVNNALVGFPVLVYRNKLMEPDSDPGNGDSFFTKNLLDNFITFSSALTAGELIQVIILPS